MSIRLPYLGRQFISPFSQNALRDYGDKLISDIIPAKKLQIDPYWHFVHLYGEEYIWSDLRLWSIRIDGINVDARKYSNKVSFYGSSSGAVELEDFLYEYIGPGTPATSLNNTDWLLIRGRYPDIQAKTGRVYAAVNLTNIIPGIAYITVRFTNSHGDSSRELIAFQVVRAPIYSYAGIVSGNSGLAQATITTYSGPKPSGKWENFKSNILETLAWFWSNADNFAASGNIISLLREGAIEQMVKQIKKDAFSEVVELIRDEVVVQSVGSMARNFLYPYHLIQQDIREFEESFYGRHMVVHIWLLDCHEYHGDLNQYKKQAMIAIIAVTIGAMVDSHFVPRLTRWNVYHGPTHYEDPFQRNDFISWLAPYEYQYLPIQGRRLEYQDLSHPATHGTGLLFPILQGLPNQPNLLGYHDGFGPPKKP